jgi:hypothetical protein
MNEEDKTAVAPLIDAFIPKKKSAIGFIKNAQAVKPTCFYFSLLLPVLGLKSLKINFFLKINLLNLKQEKQPFKYL